MGKKFKTKAWYKNDRRHRVHAASHQQTQSDVFSMCEEVRFHLKTYLCLLVTLWQHSAQYARTYSHTLRCFMSRQRHAYFLIYYCCCFTCERTTDLTKKTTLHIPTQYLCNLQTLISIFSMHIAWHTMPTYSIYKSIFCTQFLASNTMHEI